MQNENLPLSRTEWMIFDSLQDKISFSHKIIINIKLVIMHFCCAFFTHNHAQSFKLSQNACLKSFTTLWMAEWMATYVLSTQE